MPYLKGKGRLIAPDLMGMGDSEKLDPSLGKNRYSFLEQYNYFSELINLLYPN
jgi:haloalkane dehalogenase